MRDAVAVKSLPSLLLFAGALTAATLDGLAIHSTITGTGPKTVILVHGWTCDETMWAEQVPVFSKQYRVVTIDLPGHGKTPAPKGGKLTMDLFVRSIEAVRAEVNANRVVLAGHSMGTPAVVHYARRYPERVAALIFVDGRVTFGPKGPPAFNRQQWLGEDGRKARERMIGSMFGPSATPELRARIHDMMMAPSESNAADAMEAYYDPAIWKSEVLSIPILAIYAQRTAASQQPYMPAHFPDLEYHEIADAGHFLMMEKPEEFNGLVIDFLRKKARW